MTLSFFKFIAKYIHLIPKHMSGLFTLNKNRLDKSELLFGTIQYKLDYNSNNFLFIFLPLLVNISQISNDIQSSVNDKNLINITSTLIFYEKDSTNEYIHSLSDSNQLYSTDNINKWSTFILLNIIKKLEVYNLFEKVSIITQVKIINNI